MEASEVQVLQGRLAQITRFCNICNKYRDLGAKDSTAKDHQGFVGKNSENMMLLVCYCGMKEV